MVRIRVLFGSVFCAACSTGLIKNGDILNTKGGNILDDTQQPAAGSMENLKAIGSILVAGFFVILFIVKALSYFGLSFSFSDNVLEKALHVGFSDQAQFEAFKNKGGIENEHSWKGYYVYSASTMYDDKTGKLAILNLDLFKDGPGKKIASVDNLKGSLSSECGSDWVQSDVQRRANMHEATKNNMVCSIHDTGTVVSVSIQER
jgi:hypothetical protein